MRQLGGAGGGGGISAALLQVRVEELEGHNVAALALPLPCPCPSLPRVDDERLCDFSLQVQEEMSETLLRLQRSPCLPWRCSGMEQVCEKCLRRPGGGDLGYVSSVLRPCVDTRVVVPVRCVQSSSHLG